MCLSSSSRWNSRWSQARAQSCETQSPYPLSSIGFVSGHLIISTPACLVIGRDRRCCLGKRAWYCCRHQGEARTLATCNRGRSCGKRSERNCGNTERFATRSFQLQFPVLDSVRHYLVKLSVLQVEQHWGTAHCLQLLKVVLLHQLVPHVRHPGSQ